MVARLRLPTFSEPGVYVLHALADEGSRGDATQSGGIPGFLLLDECPVEDRRQRGGSRAREMTRAMSMIAALASLCAAGVPGLALAADTKGAVTFSRDVAPIFQRKCQVCHRPGTVAPMSLVAYDDARPWARSIKQRVAQREMPPWHIDKGQGIQHYKNDRSLSDVEIATIVAWVDAGAPEGDRRDSRPLCSSAMTTSGRSASRI